MGMIIFGSIVLTIALTCIFIWVTNKAYSRKWDHDNDETKGQF